MARRSVLTQSKKKKAQRLAQAGKTAEAREAYGKICQLDPKDFEAWVNFGAMSGQLGVYQDAEYAFNQAYELRPDEPAVSYNLARLAEMKQDLLAAEQHYLSYIKLKPQAVDGALHLALLYLNTGRFSDSEKYCRQVLSRQENNAIAHNCLANVLQEQGDFDEAQKHYQASLEQGADKAEIYGNLGNLFHAKGEFEASKAWYEKSLAESPKSAATLGSLGFLYFRYGHFADARRCFDQALKIEPHNPGIRWNRSLLLLLQGEFKQGWMDYEARLTAMGTVSQMGRRVFEKPRWEGKPIGSKTLLVHAEQGLGDTLQFCRYLDQIKDRVGRIVFECQPVLQGVLEDLDAVDELVTDVDGIEFDYYVPLLSLPGICATDFDNIPASNQYLHADANKVAEWKKQIDGPGKLIGLVWAGNPDNPSDKRRSLDLAQLQALFDVPGVSFYSLQKGPATAQLERFPQIHNLESQLTDFAETAAAIANLDLVITVDTAVAHLAGAMGKPVWNLVYFPADWRWFMDREDSPWYPSMRLFRQTSVEDWSPVLTSLSKALAEFAAGK